MLYIYIHHVDAYVHTRACKIPLLIYAPMKTCMPTLRSNVHNRDGASTVRIASVTRTHAFQGRCLQFHEGALVSLADGLHEFFFEKGLHMVAWYIYIYICAIIYIYISPLKSLNFTNSVWIRDSEGLSAAWRLSSPGWFDIDLPREVVQGPPAICHGIHLVFLQTSGVDFQPLHLGCLLFHIGFSSNAFLLDL